MKPFNLQHSIRLTFASDAEPGTPLPLNKEATDKLGHVPRLLRALADCYGSQLSGPTLWGGEIYLEICSDADLFNLTGAMMSDLTVTAHQLHENAQRQPPLPLAQAVAHSRCVPLLRALSQTHEKSRLTASMNVAGKAFALPHIPISDFTEPEQTSDKQKYLRAKVVGVCVPGRDFNCVVLGDMTILELPFVDYAFDLDDLYKLVCKSSALFVGSAEHVRTDVCRAVAGGKLTAQLLL